MKSGIKKNVNGRQKFINQTSGGSWSDVPRDLNLLEEKIFSIITIDAVDRDASTPEAGVKFKERPVVRLIRHKTLIIVLTNFFINKLFLRI